MLADTGRVIETEGLVDNPERVSVAYFVRVMGNHVNESLWDRVDVAKFSELDRLIRGEAVTPEVAAQLRPFARTKCSKHKLAKLSRDACNAMTELQDAGIAAFTNMVGECGRTYESLGYTLTEVAAWQLWVSGFKYMIFLGNGFLRYGLVSSGQPKIPFLLQSCF